MFQSCLSYRRRFVLVWEICEDFFFWWSSKSFSIRKSPIFLPRKYLNSKSNLTHIGSGALISTSANITINDIFFCVRQKKGVVSVMLNFHSRYLICDSEAKGEKKSVAKDDVNVTHRSLILSLFLSHILRDTF